MTDGGPNKQICEKMRSTTEGRAEIARSACFGGGHSGRCVAKEPR